MSPPASRPWSLSLHPFWTLLDRPLTSGRQQSETYLLRPFALSLGAHVQSQVLVCSLFQALFSALKPALGLGEGLN